MSKTEKLGPQGGAEDPRDLYSMVDEIVESVLDAADEEILEDLAVERGMPGLGAELMGELMLDVMRRYCDRRRSATPSGRMK